MERAAMLKELQYVDMDRGQGNIGIISNSCGLSLATNDALILEGGHPVNSMDVNESGEKPDSFYEALDLHGDDERVKVILMSCYGGHVSMAGVMRMAIKAFDRGLKKPVVFRLGGFES